MASTKPPAAEHGRDMDNDLKEWGRLMEREAVPDRLRDLARQLRDALAQRPPRDQ